MITGKVRVAATEQLEQYVDMTPTSLVPILKDLGGHVEMHCQIVNGLEQFLFRLDGMERPDGKPKPIQFE